MKTKNSKVLLVLLSLCLGGTSAFAHNQSRATIALTVKSAAAPLVAAHPAIQDLDGGVPRKFWVGDKSKLKVKLEQSTVELTPFSMKDEAGKIVGIGAWFEYQETPHAIVVDPAIKKVVGISKAGAPIETSEWNGLPFVKPVGLALLKAYE